MLTKSIAAVSALSLFASTALALDASLKNNVAVYYGQGANQPRLSHFCEQTTMDIINIGFIHEFPKAVGHFPGSNFGNQCNGNLFDGTNLLNGCHQIWEDIPKCKAAGKTVLLSIGGGTATGQSLPDDATAVWFADFLWYSFGPYNPLIASLSWTQELATVAFPRPFLDVSVDGFDFDIEYNGGAGYATMINRLRWHFSRIPERKFYISGAPQCSLPDAQLGHAIANSYFDFIWVQWYNTKGCSAADWVDGTGKFNFDAWVDVIKASANPDAKLFVGLPASEAAANAGFYISPKQAKPLIETYMKKHPKHFGGVMLWEATAGDNNLIGESSFTESIQDILYECAPPPPRPTSTVTSTQSSTSTVVSSTVPPTTTTTVPTTTSSSSIPTSSTSVATSSSVAFSSTTTSASSVSTTHSSEPSSSVTSSTAVTSSVPAISTGHSSSPTSSASSSSSATLPVASSTGRPGPRPTSSAIPTGKPTPSSPVGHGSHTVPTSTPLVPNRSSSSAAVPSATESDASSATESTTPAGGSKPTGTDSVTVPSGGESTTGAQTTGGPKPTSDGSVTTPAGITAAPSVTASPSSDAPGTTTTIIVTSYIDICPTGFATITTTITKTYCPDDYATATATGTAEITAPTSGPAVPTGSIPEGWTTTVTVCTQCAATPTTVTLTRPATTTTTDAVSHPTAPSVPEGHTTTVTFCKHCGPTGSTITITIPAPTATTPAGSGSGSNTGPDSGSAGPEEGSGSGTNPGSPGQGEAGEPPVTVTIIAPVVHSPSPKPVNGHGPGGFHPGRPSSSLVFRPSPSRTPAGPVATTATNNPVVPSSTTEGVSPVYTGAASRAGVTGFIGGVVAIALSMFMTL